MTLTELSCPHCGVTRDVAIGGKVVYVAHTTNPDMWGAIGKLLSVSDDGETLEVQFTQGDNTHRVRGPLSSFAAKVG